MINNKTLKLKVLTISILYFFITTSVLGCNNDNNNNNNNKLVLNNIDSIFNKLSLRDKILQLYLYDIQNHKLSINKTIPQGIILNRDNFKQLKKDCNKLKDSILIPKFIITDITEPFSDVPCYLNSYAVRTCRDTAIYKNWAEQMADSLNSIGIMAVKGFFADFSDIKQNISDKKFLEKINIAKITINAFLKKGIITFIKSDFSNIKDEKRKTFFQNYVDSLYCLGNNLIYKHNSLNFKKINNFKDFLTLKNNDFDIIYSNLSPEIFMKYMLISIKKNKKLRKIIDNKVYNIIKLKIDTKDFNNNICFNFNKDYFSWKTLSLSTTCIANKSSFLPLKDINNLQILQIGGLRLYGFASEIKNYCKANYKYVPNNYNSILNNLNNFSNKSLIILINDSITDLKTITKINSKTRNKNSCVINFNNISNLSRIKSYSLLQIYGNDYESAKYAAQTVFGSNFVNAKTPTDISFDIKQETGKIIKPNRLQFKPLEEVGFNKNYCDTIDSIVNMAIKQNCFPGCQIFASYKGNVLINKGFGKFSYDSSSRNVSQNTMYDIASLTKITAPTIILMYLYGKKLLNIEDNIGKYFKDTIIDWSNLPADTIIEKKTISMSDFKKLDKNIPLKLVEINDNQVTFNDTTLIRKNIPQNTIFGVPIKLLLLHKSGIYPYLPFTKITYYVSTKRKMLKEEGVKIDKMTKDEINQLAFDEFFSEKYIKNVAETKIHQNLWLKNKWRDSIDINTRRLAVDDKKNYKYSDINMILLQQMAENIIDCKADDFLEKNFYKPLGMYRTHYNPTNYYHYSCFAPTANSTWGGTMLQGDVHDPSAAVLGGVSGNAGIFSCAKDLGILFQMVLNKGYYGGCQYIDSSAIKKFTTKQKDSGRALGFDMGPNAYTANNASNKTFGHTGFTGTCAWIDPENEIVIVFLSNRVHPNADNQNINKFKVRKKISQAIYNGIFNNN
ncbi:MAG: serine hydrolase [Bacteroidales bacterium]|nr:serine hydrolase [Bacteroidales bacterium]